MSKVSLDLWQTWFGSNPMPDGLEYEPFAAARQHLWDEQHKIWELVEGKQFEDEVGRSGIPFTDDINDLLDIQEALRGRL